MVLLLIFLIILGIVYFPSEWSLLPEEKVDAPPPLMQPPAPRTVTYQVERGYIAERITGLARLAPVNQVSIYFSRGGRVQDVYVAYGDIVEEGEPLARLDVGDLEYRYELALLDFEKLELQRERDRLLYEVEGVMSEFDWRMREIDFTKAKMNIERQKEELEEATIYAPIAGMVSSISLRESNNVQAYQDVISIADLSNIQIIMNTTPQNIRTVVTGLNARIEHPDGHWLEATLTRVPAVDAELPSGDADRRLFLELAKDVEPLVEGTPVEVLQDTPLVRVEIMVQERENALLLPKGAIRSYRDRTFVRVEEDDVRKEIDIETGIESRTHVEIISGLEEGQLVIGR